MTPSAKLLIVDDDHRNIFALNAVLRSRSFECLTASSAREALDQLGLHPDVDAVLLDMMMPEMDGYQAIREIRQGPFMNVPVIAVTAQAMAGDRERCMEAGADAYISKPIDIDRLLSLFRKLEIV